MARIEFRDRIRNHGGNTWNYVVVPSAQSARLGTRARAPIRGTANGRPFRSSLLPDGRGGFTLVIHGPLRSAVGVKTGDWIRVVAEADSAPRTDPAPRHCPS